MIDAYNQDINYDIACAILTNIDTANNHFIMEKIEIVGHKHKGQSGVIYGTNGISPTITTLKGEGLKIAEKDECKIIRVGEVDVTSNHKYCREVLSTRGISKAVCSAAGMGGNMEIKILEEPVVLGWTRDSKGNIVNRHPVYVANTITSAKRDNTQNYVVYPDNYRIRKLTERECFRLQGVNDTDSDKIREVVSKSQCYKLAGNSIVVDVLAAIFQQLFTENKTTDRQLKLF